MKLKNLFHRKVRDQTAGAGYRFFLGTSTSGKRVNERSSMQMTAVYSCVRILSEAIASLPLHVYEQSNNHSQKARDHPLYFLLHDEPNPEMTSFIFRETLMESQGSSSVFSAARRAQPGDDVLHLPGNADDPSAALGKRLCADHPKWQR